MKNPFKKEKTSEESQEVENVVEQPVVEEVVEEPVVATDPQVVLENRPCEECQGDGIWDGVQCKVCLGTGKVWKEGVVIAHQTGSYIAKHGKLEKF